MAGRKTGLFLLIENGHPRSYQIKHFTHDASNPYSISSNDVFKLFIDHAGHIYVGCHANDGLNLVDVQNEGDTRFIHYGNIMKGWPIHLGGRLRSITEDSLGNIIVGTTGGLVCFSSDFDRPENIKFAVHRRASQNGYPNDIVDVYYSSDHRLYILYRTGVMALFKGDNPLKESDFEYYEWRQKDNLKDACSIVENNNKEIWVVFENGILSFSDKNHNQELIAIEDLTHKDLTLMEASVCSDSANVLVGAKEGILVISSDMFSHDRYVPPVIISNVRIHGEQGSRPVSPKETIKLLPHQRNIILYFAALDYKSSDQIQYAYKMDNLDCEWQYVGHRHEAQYTNLPKGQHRFTVKSTSRTGTWMDNETYLILDVIPTFWETKWALVLYLFIILTTITYIVVFFIIKLNRIKTENTLTENRVQFFTDISHELRTLLSLIAGPVEDVMQDPGLTEKSRVSLSLVRRNTRKMLSLVNQILDLRKIQLRKMKLLLEEIDVYAGLDFLMKDFQLKAKEMNLAFTLQTDLSDSSSYHIWGDWDKFATIINNLLSNAFKYSTEGQDITVYLFQNEIHVVIKVADHGIGIASDKIETLFNRFESLFNDNITSTGLGLFLVKELMTLHHGKVEVESQEGEGSTFTLSFPKGREIFEKDPLVEFRTQKNQETIQDSSAMSLDEYDNPDAFPADDLPAPEQEKELVLVVEDNADMRNYLTMILKNNYRVATANNGQEGQEKASDLLPGLILSDVMMPVMDGMELLKSIKSKPDLRHIPFVFLSAKSALEDRISGLEFGADDYITKPFSSDYLNVRIRNIMRTRREMIDYYLNSRKTTGAVTSDKMSDETLLFVQQINDFVLDNLTDVELSIDDISRHMYVSHSVLYRRIKAVTGMAPVAFINHVRISKAVELITEGRLSMGEVSDSCGFSSQAYFNYCFKKEFGTSPSNYRKIYSSSDKAGTEKK